MNLTFWQKTSYTFCLLKFIHIYLRDFLVPPVYQQSTRRQAKKLLDDRSTCTSAAAAYAANFKPRLYNAVPKMSLV